MKTDHIHIIDALVSLQWLLSPDRVQFKVPVLTYKALGGSAATYPSQLFRIAIIITVSSPGKAISLVYMFVSVCLDHNV